MYKNIPDDVRFDEEIDGLLSKINSKCFVKVDDDAKKKENSTINSTTITTYLCPISDCVFTCPINSDENLILHLKSSHGYSNCDGYKFIVL